MSDLLYIQASPRKEHSFSTKVADEFLSSYESAHPGVIVDHFSIWEEGLPEFNKNMLEAKYAIVHQQAHTKEQERAWGMIKLLFQRFAAAEKYLFSVPMWNFNIPYKLKQYIDLITQATLTFEFVDGQYKGLLKNKKAMLICARGGDYSAAPYSDYDMQIRYLRLWLGFIGITDVSELIIGPTIGLEKEILDKKVEDIIQEGKRLAVSF